MLARLHLLVQAQLVFPDASVFRMLRFSGCFGFPAQVAAGQPTKATAALLPTAQSFALPA